MFRELTIKNFRGFSSTTIPDVQRVNLITGRNGSGKSALLEAIFLNCSVCNTNTLAIINDSRGEKYTNPQNDKPFNSLFHNFRNSLPVEIFAEWVEKQSAQTRELTIKALRSTVIQGMVSQARPVISGVEFEFKVAGTKKLTAKAEWVVHERVLSPSFVGNANNVVSTSEVAQTTEPRLPQPQTFSQVQLIHNAAPSASIISASLVQPNPRAAGAFVYSAVVAATRERNIERLIELVRLIDVRVKNIIPLNEGGNDTVYIDIGEGELFPMTVMGTGFINVLHIASYIHHSNARVIMIDELEDGIHYLAFKRIAESLMKIADAVDVQMFITTHSGEMINAFSEASASSKFESICALRLTNSQLGLKVTHFDKQDLINSREIELDVR